MKKDLIIGCITDYDYQKIKPWVNSINQCGFDGDKIVIIYNGSFDVAEKLNEQGFGVIAYQRNYTKKCFEANNLRNVVVDRFFSMWSFLSNCDLSNYRYLITTDVRDVIFQKNPVVWLENNLKDKKICASSEHIKYKDEVWGKNNLIKSFGQQIFENLMAENPIYNAGVMAGDIVIMKDLFLSIALYCNGMPSYIEGGGGPDQAAYNILLSLSPFKDIVAFADHDSGWAAQLGTTADPNKIGLYKSLLLGESPLFDGASVKNSKGEDYMVVHQYDRVPMLKDFFENKFK